MGKVTQYRMEARIVLLFLLIAFIPNKVFSKPLIELFEHERSVDVDIIHFCNGDILRGEILNESIGINSTYAAMTVKFKQCAGISFDQTRQDSVEIFTVNYNRITGYQDKRNIRFKLSGSGTIMDIPVHRIKVLLFKIRRHETAVSQQYERVSNLYIMNNGDTLTGNMENKFLEMDTGYGEIPISLEEITELIFPDEMMSDVSLVKKNGDKVTGKLKTLTFTLNLNIGTRIADVYQDKIIKVITGITALKAPYVHEFRKTAINDRHKSRAVFLENEYQNPLGMTFRRINPGEFYMGSPAKEAGRNQWETRHLVVLKEPFFIQTTEVTQEQWADLMGTNPSYFKGQNRPVESVSWFDVQEFIGKLNALDNSLVYRLPTEAEWEYAARAGSSGAYSFGRNGRIDRYAWYEENSGGRTQRVAQKRPNAWGLYDMHGNVWEWCLDRGRWNKGVETDTYLEGIVNPISTAGEDRINRGGSFSFDKRFSRSSSRYCNAPGSRQDSIGFRLTGHLKK